MTTKTYDWDPSEHLNTDEDVAAYLSAALEDGDPGLFQAALGDVAKAYGMTRLAEATHLGRESLYKALRADSSPSFRTVTKIAAALGVPLRVDSGATPVSAH